MTIRLTRKEFFKLIELRTDGFRYKEHVTPKRVFSGDECKIFRELGYSADKDKWGPEMKWLVLDAVFKGIVTVENFRRYCEYLKWKNDSEQMQEAHEKRRSDLEFVKSVYDVDIEIVD